MIKKIDDYSRMYENFNHLRSNSHFKVWFTCRLWWWSAIILKRNVLLPQVNSTSIGCMEWEVKQMKTYICLTMVDNRFNKEVYV